VSVPQIFDFIFELFFIFEFF